MYAGKHARLWMHTIH